MALHVPPGMIAWFAPAVYASKDLSVCLILAAVSMTQPSILAVFPRIIGLPVAEVAVLGLRYPVFQATCVFHECLDTPSHLTVCVPPVRQIVPLVRTLPLTFLAAILRAC